MNKCSLQGQVIDLYEHFDFYHAVIKTDDKIVAVFILSAISHELFEVGTTVNIDGFAAYNLNHSASALIIVKDVNVVLTDSEHFFSASLSGIVKDCGNGIIAFLDPTESVLVVAEIDKKFLTDYLIGKAVNAN